MALDAVDDSGGFHRLDLAERPVSMGGQADIEPERGGGDLGRAAVLGLGELRDAPGGQFIGVSRNGASCHGVSSRFYRNYSTYQHALQTVINAAAERG